MQFIAFLKEPATTAAIEVILAGILHAALKRFGRVFGDHQDGKKPDKPGPDEQKSDGPENIQLPIKFLPTLWFAHEEVLVTVMANIETHADFKIAELLVPEGFRRAAQWIDRHGVTHPYLTYHIRNGMLDNKPTPTDRPLEE
jgi:hypothetical protein